MKRIKCFLVIMVFIFLVGDFPISCWKVNAAGTYYTIDYSECAGKYRVNMKGIPGYGDCAIASIASIEAYWQQNVNGVYEQIFTQNGNSVYINSWNNMGYSSSGYNIETLYQALKSGPVIVHRTGNGGHYSVVVAYEGSTSSLQSSGFKVMEVQRYNRTDGSYGYPSSWGNAYKVNMDTWATYAGGNLDQIVTRKNSSIPDTNVPVVTNAYISQVDKDGYTVTATATDDVGITKILFPTQRGDQTQDIWNWYEGVRNADGSYSYRIPCSDFENWEGYYRTEVRAYDAAGNISDPWRLPLQYIDRTAPTISNVKVSNVTETGYMVTCLVTDNTGVNRVQFPTWTTANGQDDIVENWPQNNAVAGMINGSNVTFQVKDEAHNYERGTYSTHIYAYDNYGNISMCVVPDVKVENIFKPAKTVIYGNYEYSLFDDILTWEDAQKKCKEMGGNLVSITSSGESNVVKQLLVGGKREVYYIGGKKVSGRWTWSDGSLFSYTNWFPGEPNNYNGNENYIEIHSSNGQWIDNNATLAVGRGFILKKIKSGWCKADGKWYYFNSRGVKQIGWQKISGNWYYLEPSNGVMQTGWLKLGGKWYYLDSSGVMQIGWLKIGKTWYYLNSDGAMQTGWLKIGKTWYYLNSDGAMQTGWLKLGGKWYYLNSSGAMQTGWIKLGSTWYYLNSDGAMQTGWLKLGSKWYYLKDNGAMVNTMIVINGRKNYFNSSGVWLGAA